MAFRAESSETTDCVPLHGAYNMFCCLFKLLSPASGKVPGHSILCSTSCSDNLLQVFTCVWGQCPELKDVLQNQWLVHTGAHSCCGIYIFDFATLSWSKPEMTGKPLRPRWCHLATCHEDTLVMMGGNTSACTSNCNRDFTSGCNLQTRPVILFGSVVLK